MEIGVLVPVQKSKYGTPVFIIPKKEGTVILIIDDKKSNQRMVIKPHPLNIIYYTMQKLEGLQYTKARYQNMFYYTIDISPFSQDMTNILTGFF